MDKAKKAIREECKKASDYYAFRTPLGVWTVVLFNEKQEQTMEFEFDESFPRRDKEWVWTLLEKIDDKKKNNNSK